MSMRMERSEREALKGNFSTWKTKEASVCVRCRRTIERGDVTRVEIFYDDFGKFQTVTHHDCRDVSYRARLTIPRERTFVELSGGIRRLIMSAQTDATTEQVQDEATAATESKKAKGTAKKKAGKGKNRALPKKGKTSTNANKETTVAKTAKKGKKSATKKSATKKGAKKGKAKASANGAKTPTREGTGSMAVTVAQRLKPHLGKNKRVGKVLKAMANGEAVKHKDLEALRDEVKVVAAKFRETDKLKEASELSSTNQLVRRLERAAR